MNLTKRPATSYNSNGFSRVRSAGPTAFAKATAVGRSF